MCLRKMFIRSTVLESNLWMTKAKINMLHACNCEKNRTLTKVAHGSSLAPNKKDEPEKTDN